MTLRILFTLPGMVLVFQHASVNLSTFLEAGVRFRLSSLFDRVRRCPLITVSLPGGNGDELFLGLSSRGASNTLLGKGCLVVQDVAEQDCHLRGQFRPVF
uniref:Secreted protein n=2 Tax=Loa loa TaxID=7209 RepID=A0A1I7VYN7_LOALO